MKSRKILSLTITLVLLLSVFLIPTTASARADVETYTRKVDWVGAEGRVLCSVNLQITDRYNASGTLLSRSASFSNFQCTPIQAGVKFVRFNGVTEATDYYLRFSYTIEFTENGSKKGAVVQERVYIL